MLSGLTTTIITYPFDLLRTMMIYNDKKEKLVFRFYIKKLYHRGGVNIFFSALSPTLLSSSLTVGFNFWFHVMIKNISLLQDKFNHLQMFSGFLSGAISKIVFFPLDTLRKRKQILLQDFKNINSTKLMLNILKNEGKLSFYKGLSLGILKSALSTGSIFFIYDNISNILS